MSQYLIDVLAEQRNEMANRLAQAEARVRVLTEEVERLAKEINHEKEADRGPDGSS